MKLKLRKLLNLYNYSDTIDLVLKILPDSPIIDEGNRMSFYIHSQHLDSISSSEF